MSRHRNVRHLIDEEDYYNDYDDDYYDDYDDYGAAPQQAAKKKNQQQKKQQQQKSQKKQPQKPQSTKTSTPQKLSSPSPPGFRPSLPGAAGKGGTAATIASPSPPSKPPTQTQQQNPAPLKVPSQLLERANADVKSKKPPLTLVVLGHVDAGKSTLTGRLIYHAATEQERQKSQSLDTGGEDGSSHNETSYYYSSRIKKPANFAWLLDEDEQERIHGITMDIATKQLETDRYQLVLQDAPGHADYVPAFITGAAAADAAIAVVDVTNFRTALTGGGQLKEHLTLAKGLGIPQVLVGLNKMDLVGWSEEAFTEISTEISKFMTVKLGYAPQKIRIVPCSGLTGVNVVRKATPNTCPELSSWYKGSSLWQAIDGFEVPNQQLQLQKQLEKPVRLIITDVLGEKQTKGVAVRAKVVQGWLSQGESVQVLPVGDIAPVFKLSSLQQRQQQQSSSSQQYVATGEMVDLVLGGMDPARLCTGNVLGRPAAMPPAANKFQAKVFVMEGLTIPIIAGTQVSFHMHHLDVPAAVSKLLAGTKPQNSRINSNSNDGGAQLISNKKKLRSLRALTANMQATVEITLTAPIAMERFQDCRALGRFVLRRSGDSICVGRIEEVLRE